MSALDKWLSLPLQVRDQFNPLVSKDALEKPRHSRSGFASIHNAFAIHGKEQSYETDLEPVMIQKGRYLNPPSNPSKINVHWGFENEPDGPFINGGYPSKETNTFIRANEPLRLTQFQRKARDPIKEPEMFNLIGNKLPDYKEKEFITLDTYTQRAIRDQVYADGTPRSGVSMDIAMASQQQSQQQGQNDKLFEIMGAIMQSAQDTKRMANLMQLSSDQPVAPIAPSGAPEVVPVSEFMKQRKAISEGVEKKFDEILKQRPNDIRRQILEAQQFAANVEEQFKAEEKEVPPEFLSFAEKLQAFKDDEFQEKWGESKRVKKSEMLKENKEAIKALAGLLENVPIYTEVKTPMSSRKPSLIPKEEKLLEQAPSEAPTMTKSQKEKAMMDALSATLPQQAVRERIYMDGQDRNIIIQGNIIYESLGREMKPIAAINADILKKYGGFEGFLETLKREGEQERILDRAKKDKDEASSYDGYRRGSSISLKPKSKSASGIPIVEPMEVKRDYNNKYEDALPIIIEVLSRDKVIPEDINILRAIMQETDKKRFENLLLEDDDDFLNQINTSLFLKRDLLENAKSFYNDIMKKSGRRASIASTIDDEDITTTSELNIDPEEDAKTKIQKLEAQVKSKPTKTKSLGGSPTGEFEKKQSSKKSSSKPPSPPALPLGEEEYKDLPRSQIIYKFNLNESLTESKRLQNLVNSINQLSKTELNDLIDSVENNFSRAEYSKQDQVINRHLLKYLLYLKEKGKNLNTAGDAYNYISEEVIKAQSSETGGGAKFRAKTIYNKFSKSPKANK